MKALKKAIILAALPILSVLVIAEIPNSERGKCFPVIRELQRLETTCQIVSGTGLEPSRGIN
jgi:hypothetical protein